MSHIPQSDRILILDDHVIIRRGLRNLINIKLPTYLVTDVATIQDLFSHLRSESVPGLVILDLQVSDGNAMEILSEFRTNYPSMRILIYSMNPEWIYEERVLSMGCQGYLNKEAPEEEVIAAVRTILAGGKYVGKETQERGTLRTGDRARNPYDQLSKQELLVLDHILNGFGVTEIAQRMGLGMSTVATYKSRLFEKLDVTNILELQTLVKAYGYRRS